MSALTLIQDDHSAGNGGGTITCPAGATLLIAAWGGNNSIGGATWNSVAMTEIVRVSNTAAIWILANPDVGSHAFAHNSATHCSWVCYWVKQNNILAPQRSGAEGSGTDGWGSSQIAITCTGAKKYDFIAIAAYEYYSESIPDLSGTGIVEDQEYTNAYGRGSVVGHILSAAGDDPTYICSHESHKEDENAYTCWAAFRGPGGGSYGQIIG